MKQQINVTKEVYRITGNEVDLKIVKILENWRSVYGNSFNDSLKSSLILWDKHWIRVRTLYHLINWEWSERWFLVSGLHSTNKVQELLKNWKIRVWHKNERTWNWEELDYNGFNNNPPLHIKVTTDFNDTRSPRRWKDWKGLFSSNWSEEDIALLIREAELNIRDILTEKWIPLTWIPWNYWKDTLVNNVPIGNIIHIFNINGKSIEIRLWWKYDSNWNINYSVETLFPN